LRRSLKCTFPALARSSRAVIAVLHWQHENSNMRALSEPARSLLAQLQQNGGGCPFARLSRVAYGLAPSFLTAGERSRLNALIRSLERHGLVVIHRDWGTLGYGRPTWIEVTQSGAAALQPRDTPAAPRTHTTRRSSTRPARRRALAAFVPSPVASAAT
jgi:hypothetical protein